MTNKHKQELANWLRDNNANEASKYSEVVINKLQEYPSAPNYLWISKGMSISKSGIQKFITKYADKVCSTREEVLEGIGKELNILIDNTIQPIDIVIAFDDTGSMSKYRNAVKKKALEFIDNFFRTLPNLQMGICAFGDYCDPIDIRFQYTNLTADKKVLQKAVKNYKSTSGGDEDEFYELVIKNIVEKTTWRKDSKHIFILIGDCNPHPIGYYYGNEIKNNQIDWKKECEKARDKGIIIDTLKIHNDSKYNWYEKAAEITGGICTPFDNPEKVEHAIKAMIFVDTNRDEFDKQKEAAIKSGDKQVIETYRVIEQKRTKTELAELLSTSTGKEMVVCFHRQITDKYLEEVIRNYIVSHTGKIDSNHAKPLSKLCIEGELTTVKCKLIGMNKLGRYDVFDLIEKKNKQIDPRTIEYIEMDGIKTSKK